MCVLLLIVIAHRLTLVLCSYLNHKQLVSRLSVQMSCMYIFTPLGWDTHSLTYSYASDGCWGQYEHQISSVDYLHQNGTQYHQKEMFRRQAEEN